MNLSMGHLPELRPCRIPRQDGRSSLTARTHPATPKRRELALLPYAELQQLASIREHTWAFVILGARLAPPPVHRRAADIGAWAFASSFDDDQLPKLRKDMSDALMRACAALDGASDLLNEWRPTAVFMADDNNPGSVATTRRSLMIAA